MTPLILALDCSLRWTAAAVFSEGSVLSAEQLDIGRRQAAELPLAAERVLAKAGRSFRDVRLVAVTNGPGYFTGIRVGASYAAALAYGLGVKVVPVSTLHMLAYPHLSCACMHTGVLAAVYAGRGCVYAASFGCADGLPPGEYQRDGLETWLARHGNVTVVSDDPSKLAESLPICPAEVRQTFPDASAVARIAWHSRESAVSPMEMRVLYHRAPQVG